jgi:hypothetical protein
MLWSPKGSKWDSFKDVAVKIKQSQEAENGSLENRKTSLVKPPPLECSEIDMKHDQNYTMSRLIRGFLHTNEAILTQEELVNIEQDKLATIDSYKLNQTMKPTIGKKFSSLVKTNPNVASKNKKTVITDENAGNKTSPVIQPRTQFPLCKTFSINRPHVHGKVVILQVPDYIKKFFTWFPANQAYILTGDTYYPFNYVEGMNFYLVRSEDKWIKKLVSDNTKSFLQRFGFWFQLEQSMYLSPPETSKWKDLPALVDKIKECQPIENGQFKKRTRSLVNAPTLKCSDMKHNPGDSLSKIIRSIISTNNAMITSDILLDIKTKKYASIVSFEVTQIMKRTEGTDLSRKLHAVGK